jgi:hypothetical protein
MNTKSRLLAAGSDYPVRLAGNEAAGRPAHNIVMVRETDVRLLRMIANAKRVGEMAADNGFVVGPIEVAR